MTVRGLLCGALLTLVFAQLAQAQEKPCNLNRFSTLPITTIPDGRFTVPAVLNGQKLDFLVDTGGVVATIDRGQASNNLHLTPKYTPRALKGVAGDSLNFVATLEKFSLGRLEGANLGAYLDDRLPPGVDGTLSPDMMRHYDVDIDLMRGTLSLFSQDHCPGKVVHWTKSGYVVLPMEVETDGHIRVPVTVDGVKFTALLDTGAQHSLISMSMAKKLGISENSPDLKLVPGSKREGDSYADDVYNIMYKRYDYPFKLLDFNGIAVSKPRLQIVSDIYLPRGMDMLVGISLLRRLHLYVAYGEQKLYITPAGAN